MTAEVWNLLHDGVIEEAHGVLHGQLKLRVAIAYLRRMFSTEGGSIFLTLKGCSRFEYTPYEMRRPIQDLSEVAALRPWIVQAEERDGSIQVSCSEGELAVSYSEYTITLDDGREIDLDQLDAAAGKYWSEWSDRTSST